MRIKSFLLVLILLLPALACTSSATPAVTEEVAPPTDVEVVAEPTATTPPPEPTAVEHKMIPGELPELQSGVVGDQDSSVTAGEKRAPGGDRFTFTRFERPFNSETMDEYYPVIDIQDGLFFEDDVWLYAVIHIKGDEASRELTGKYGFEIDLDVDGGGDWLVLVSNPVSSEWSTDGVGLWFDTNDDVGGEVPTTTDKVPAGGDGYESQVFGTGTSDDPDMGWARIAPNDPNTVQIAVKRDILSGDKTYLVGLWAGNEDLDPALFDISDHFTHEQAGASVTELDIYYPIKEVSALDNTCRMAVGFQPSGSEPGICPLPPPPGGGEPPENPSCPAEFIVCFTPVTYVGPTVCYCNQP